MGLAHSPSIVTDGLALYLDAANAKSYPGTGTTWFDLSGNNKNAIKNGTQSPDYPQFNNNYFTFTDGVTSGANYSRFDVSSIPSFSSLSAFAWYRTSNTTASKTIIRMNNSDFELSVNGSSTVFATAGTNWNDISVSKGNQTNATDGNWHQIGLTFTGATLKGYFDSSEFAQSIRSTSTTTASGILRIGTRDDFSAQHYVGDIALIAVYSRVLTPDEIKQNYAATRGRFGL